MVFLSNNEVLINNGSTANALMQAGFPMRRVKPDRRNKIKSVFVMDTLGQPDKISDIVCQLERDKIICPFI